MRHLAALGAIILAGGFGRADQAPGPTAHTSLEEMRVLQRAFAAAAKEVAPSVVTVVIDRERGTGPSARQVRMVDGRVQVQRGRNWEPAPGAGTGVIISPDGYVLTSTHYTTGGTVKRALVVMPDGTAHEAEVLGRDEGREVVLLKIEADDLPVPDFADPQQVRVGQWAVALGRTYGEVEPSISAGIVSATGRIAGRAIQTDAAISPINYGGPLVDLQGRVLGICTPLSTTPMLQGTAFYDSGIGFAAPVPDLLRVLPRLVKGEVLRPGFLGIGFDTDRVEPGAAIQSVVPDTAAAKVGLKPKDVVLEFQGQAVRNAFDLMNRIGRYYVGDEVTLVIQRGNQALDLTVTLGERPQPRPRTRPASRPTSRPTSRPAPPNGQ